MPLGGINSLIRQFLSQLVVQMVFQQLNGRIGFYVQLHVKFLLPLLQQRIPPPVFDVRFHHGVQHNSQLAMAFRFGQVPDAVFDGIRNLDGRLNSPRAIATWTFLRSLYCCNRSNSLPRHFHHTKTTRRKNVVLRLICLHRLF